MICALGLLNSRRPFGKLSLFLDWGKRDFSSPAKWAGSCGVLGCAGMFLLQSRDYKQRGTVSRVRRKFKAGSEFRHTTCVEEGPWMVLFSLNRSCGIGSYRLRTQHVIPTLVNISAFSIGIYHFKEWLIILSGGPSSCNSWSFSRWGGWTRFKSPY